jgi:hypothetical protein
MQLFMLFIDSNTLHVSSVTRSSSGAQETVCAARCRIQLSFILSFCLSHAVSVQVFVGPGLVCDGCPLGGVRLDWLLFCFLLLFWFVDIIWLIFIFFMFTCN